MTTRAGYFFALAAPVAALIAFVPAAAAQPVTLPASANAPADADQSWSYELTSSCEGLEKQIREGADFWGDANEGSGIPVTCQSGPITDCGDDGDEAIGCNYGDNGDEAIGCNYGDRITLSTEADDFALIAAHEFGHIWKEHSDVECMAWDNAETVMSPTMC